MKNSQLTPHLGYNIKRIREIRRIKQDTVAKELNITQQAVSAIEDKRDVDDETLKKIAKILNTTVEDIKNFQEEQVFNNHSYDNSTVYNTVGDVHYNPIEKISELYDRIIKSKDSEIEELKARISTLENQIKK